MAERRRSIPEDQNGLLEAKPECAILVRVLSGFAEPLTAGEVRENARWMINSLTSKGLAFPYEITDPLLNLGLGRLKRSGIAERSKTGWELTDEAYEREGEIIRHAQALTQIPPAQ